MNKLLWLSLVVLLCSCGASDQGNSQTNSGKTEYKGLIIDPAIKGKMPRRNSDTSILSLAALNINMLENDKPVDRPFLISLPCYAAATYFNDTLSIVFNPILGGSFGFYIQKYKDSCWVSHVFSSHEARTGPYRLHPGDSLTKPGLIVPCRFTVILDKNQYKDKEFAYGFVQGLSNDYYKKTDSVDTKMTIEFQGYFRAPVIGSRSSIQ
jgi:hypothetical protein